MPAINLVENGVINHLLKDTFLAIHQEEVLVALRVGHDVIDQDAYLVSETLVVLLVALPEHHFKWSFQRRDHFGVDGELVNGLLATDFN